jgi:hypothetical protein
MITYGRNLNTGKYHRIDMPRLDGKEASMDETELDDIPMGEHYGGYFILKDGVLKWLPDSRPNPNHVK